MIRHIGCEFKTAGEMLQAELLEMRDPVALLSRVRRIEDELRRVDGKVDGLLRVAGAIAAAAAKRAQEDGGGR